MKIATNTPASFYAAAKHEFVRLGPAVDGVSIIVIMLEKNWGGASIEKIDAITHWVSSYPPEVDCYIIGAETTIPTVQIAAHGHAARDKAVRRLCDEVLQRSRSIGVRGEITRHYLLDLIGCTEDQVDIIYSDDIGGNHSRIVNYIEKNNKLLMSLEKSISSFQSRPKVIYEQPVEFKDEIYIHMPHITYPDSGVRLNADIDIDGKKTTIWCETDLDYEEYLLFERSDAFLCVVLPFAMRSGKDIVCEAPVSEGFLHNLNEVLIPLLCNHDSLLYPTKIVATPDAGLLGNGGAVATGMSCGVDSMYTANLYQNTVYKGSKLTHLYCGNYLYGNSGRIYERAKSVSQDMGLPLVRTGTNVNSEFRLPHIPTHFFKTMFGVFSLKKLFKSYYYSTAHDIGNINLRDNGRKDTADFELLLLYIFSCDQLRIITGGAKSDRVGKTRALVSFPVAWRHLNVCLNPHGETNCGTCGKCVRTLLTLDGVPLSCGPV